MHFREKAIMGSKGQIVIPKVFRDAFGLVPGKKIVLEVRNNELVIEGPGKSSVDVFREIARKGKSLESYDPHEYERRLAKRFKA